MDEKEAEARPVMGTIFLVIGGAVITANTVYMLQTNSQLNPF